jgi:hypothetical protein
MSMIVIFLAACQPSVKPGMDNSPTTEEAALAAVRVVTITETPQPKEKAINPLTGQEVDDPEILNRRPVMVKVSNHPQNGRPHAGLSFADIVFDYNITGGMNRFLALYYGQDCTQIGPVRSGRLVDRELVQMYSGVLAYGSADNDTDVEITATLGNYAINNFEAPEPVFTGTDTHSEDPVNRVFANSAAVSEYVTNQGLSNKKPDLPGMVFSKTPPLGAKTADQISIYFNYLNRGDWRYDHDSDKYLRWIEYREDESKDTYEMIPLVDRVTGKQLAFSNVIIIFAKYTELAPTKYQIDIWKNDKGQPAYFFRDGMMVEGTWKAKNDTDPMQFFDAGGNSMALKPGNTWIVITSMQSTFKETAPGQWEMFFIPPAGS